MNLVEKYKPIVKLHPNEKFFPIGWNDWLQRTEPAKAFPDGSQGRLFPTDKDGNPLPNDFAKLQPTQALYHIMNNDDGSVDLAYMYLFAYNGSKRLLGVAPTGAHSADVEIFFVHLLPSGELGFYGLTTHGQVQVYNVHPSIRASRGGAYDNNETIDFENGRPVVYSAINAHAFYGQPGSYFRFYGFGNDNTADGPAALFFYDNALNSPAWDYMNELGLKNGKPSVLALQMQLYQQGKPPLDRETKKPQQLYRKVVPHFFSLKRFKFAMWVPYLLYLVLPLFVMRTKSKHRARIAVGVFFLQFYVLKAFFHFFGNSFGIPQDKEDIFGFLFPFRFY